MLERRDRLRKLAPVMGRETADLLSVAGDVDPRLRRHTDALIAVEAYRRLGQTFRQDEILLPPPSPEQARGPIPLGKVFYNDKAIGEFGLFEEEINRHTAIVGASGAGKTVAAFHLVLNLVKRGVRVVVFDPKRSYRSLLPLLDPEQVRIYSLARPEVSPYVQNFFLPPEGVNPELYHNLSQVVMSDVLYGGHGSYAILSEAVRRLRRQSSGDGGGGFTMRDVAEEVNEVASAMRKGNRMGDWSATAIRMTSVLTNAPIGPIVNVRENHLQQSVEQARLSGGTQKRPLKGSQNRPFFKGKERGSASVRCADGQPLEDGQERDCFGPAEAGLVVSADRAGDGRPAGNRLQARPGEGFKSGQGAHRGD